MDKQSDYFEVIKCESHIIQREKRAIQNFGYNSRIKRIGSKRIQLITSGLLHLKSIGFLLIFLSLIIKRRNIIIDTFRGSVIYDDHSNNLIKNNIFAFYNERNESLYDNIKISWSFYTLLKGFFFLKPLMSYHRSKPNSIPVTYALCQYWAYFFIYSNILPNKGYSGLLIVDDFGPKRMALVMAAKMIGLKVAVVAMSDAELRVKNYPLLQYDTLFCWNRAQSLEGAVSCHVVSHMKRSVLPIKKIKYGNDKKLTVGIAMNAFYNNKGLINLLSHLQSLDWIKNIIVRFHPRSEPYTSFSEISNVKCDVFGGDSKDFLTTLDLLICGGTSFIEEAIQFGVPVIYDASLDISPSFTYVKKGYIIDISGKKVDFKILNEINDFYESESWKMKRNDYSATDPRAIPIEEAVERLIVE